MFSEMSESIIKGTASEYARVGDEPYTYEVIRDTLYIFSSELATLRMFKKYNQFSRNQQTDQGYSENLGVFYFAITYKAS